MAQPPPLSDSSALRLPPGVSLHDVQEGELGPLIWAKDWSQTNLGPVESWPATLRGYVRMLLPIPTPAIIFWGPELNQIYNDGYAHIMGPRHPAHLGSPYEVCWPETYPLIYPWMRQVLERGEIVRVNQTLIPLTRHGFTEEAFFNFSLTPVRGDTDRIEGVFQLVFEITEKVITDRRKETVRLLGPQVGALAPSASPIDTCLKTFATNPSDIRFAQIYLTPESANGPVLAGSVGCGDANSEKIRLLAQAVVSENAGRIVEHVQTLLPHEPEAPWPEPTRAAVILPIRRSESEAARGALVLGISPRLRYDADYAAFFESLAREVAFTLAVDEVRRAKDALIQAHATAQVNLRKLNGVVENLSEGMILADPDGTLRLLNPEALRIHEFESIEAMVSHLQIYPQTFTLQDNSGAVIPRDQWPMSRVLRGEKFFDYEVALSRSDTGRHWIASYGGTPVFDERGNLILAALTIRDVTEQKKGEFELKAAVRARDEFLSIASHELKTPITSLKLQLQMTRRHIAAGLNEAETVNRLSRAIDISSRQVDRLTQLVEDLLDVSRIGAGRMEFNFTDVSLTDLVAETVDRHAHQLEAAGCRVTLRLAPGVRADCDRYRIEQVVTNLLTNAAKYGARNPVEVTVAYAVNGDPHAELRVTDHGIGISPDKHELVFERFERAVGNSNISGLGLGLYISREIVREHDGTIQVQSEPGVGSTFTVRLPIDNGAEKYETRTSPAKN